MAYALEVPMEENREIEIDLRKIFSMLRKKIIYIVLIGFIGAAVSGCATNFFIQPKYTTSVKMYVNSNSDSLISSNGTITSSDYDASQKLVNTYLVVVTSNTFCAKVADNLGNGLTAGQIKSMMDCSQIEETLAFQVSVTNQDPELAATVANTIAELCPDEIVRVLKVGGVEVIDYASTPTKPSSPNLEKNILIGFGIAFAVAFAAFFVKELFDTRILSETDLTRDFEIPVLGTVPRLVPVEEKKDEAKSGDTIADVAKKLGKGNE